MKFWGKIAKFRHEIFHDFSCFQSGTRILEIRTDTNQSTIRTSYPLHTSMGSTSSPKPSGS